MCHRGDFVGDDNNMRNDMSVVIFVYLFLVLLSFIIMCFLVDVRNLVMMV